MRRSPSALLSLSNLSTLNLSTTFWLLASLIACLFVIASPLLAQQAPILVTQAVDNSVRTVLPGNVHPLARAEFDQGEAPSDLMLHRMMLVLKRSDQQETTLRRLIENQQNKKSSSYHQWLTPAEFGAQFGPADSDIAAVTNWLIASGFQVTSVSNGRTVIEFNGTAGQVKQAFGTAIHNYVVKGESHWANASNPSIPTALAPVVAGVNSLSGFRRKAQNIYVGTYSEKTRQLTSPSPNLTYIGACSPFSPDNCYALGPYDFANIYDVLPLWTAATPINGTGQTIAIVGDTAINPDDAPTFWGMFGLGVNGVPMPTLNIICDGPCPGFNGDEPEADIDTQWSGAVAPGATIDFVTAENTETDAGIDLAALHIVDLNIAPVMSESYGECELGLGSNGVGFYGVMWEQAAVQGITVMVSTGDQGSAGCDFDASAAQYGLNVNGLASTQWNVAVGGTDFNQYNNWSTYWNLTNNATTQQSVKNATYIPETTWNDSCTNGLLLNLPGGSSNAETNCNNANLQYYSYFLRVVGGSGGESGLSGGASLGYGWLKPSWQTGTGVPADNARDLPDVSLLASNGFVGSFYVICQSDQTGGAGCNLDTLQGYGGTSVASPAFAGIMALVNQAQHGPQGNANLVLYKLASNQPTAFHDVPAGSTIAMPCYKGEPNSTQCVTNVGTDTYGVLSGFSTTAKYDLATGLGSVDANKLVTDWGDVSFTPTTTTLTLSVPANTTHGALIPVTVSVVPSPGSWSTTQSEDVSLLVSPKPGAPSIDWANLTSGSASWSTNLLPGGTYQVIAHYGGDKTYGGSYSAPSATFTINPESSSVYMPGLVTQTGYVTSVVYGTGATDLYLLRADVLNSQALYCTNQVFGETACPTGTITFTDNGNALDGGTFKMNSFGYTEDQGIQLTGGSHTLKAAYGGDASYNASNISTTVTVTTAPTLINDVSAPPTANAGAQFTVAAIVTTSSYGVAPTGTVKFFYSGTQLLGTVQLTPTNGNIYAVTPITAALAASLNTSIPTAGTYNITATYSGDGNYAAVTTSNSVQIVVSSATPNFTLSANPTSLSVAQGTNGTSTITVNPTNGFTGSVSLAVTSTLPSGVTAAFVPNPTTGTSVLTLTASASAAVGGPTAVTVTGTSGTLAPETTTVNLTVTPPPNFTLSANPTSLSVAEGANGTSTITVNPTNGFTGSVTLAVTSTLPTGVTAAFGTNPTTNTSVLTLTASASAAVGGPTAVTITGTSGTLAPETTTVNLTVNQTFTVPGTLTAPAAANPGQSTTTTMSIATGNGGNFTNNVTFSTCSGLPTGATCSFNPTQINANATSPQTVTITVQTAGPFTGVAGQARRTYTRRASLGQKPRLWLPLSLPLAGMLLVGLAGRRLPRSYKIVGLCLALALAGFLVACGGSSSSTPPPVVTVTPNTVNTLYPDLTGAPAQFTQQQFSATVSNTTSQTVTWAAGGVTGGNSTVGTITTGGLYTAPATLPNPASVPITATSTAATSPGTATVNLQTPTPAGTYNPITLTVTEGSINNPTQFSLTVN